MLFRTQIIFCSSELRLHFRIAEVGSLLSLNRAWRAQVTFRTQNYLPVWVECLAATAVFSCVKMMSRLRCQRHNACQSL